MVTRLRSARDGLTEVERRVADWVLGHLDETPYASVQAVAREARASVATVVRLTKALGCEGFADFKIRLARQVPPGLSAICESVGDEDAPGELVSKVFGGNRRSLDETLAMLDADALDRAARRIARARRCEIYGFGSSAYVARDTALRLAHLGIDARADDGALETAISSLRLGKRDVAIGISHSGRSAATVASLRAAREQGALTVGISNYQPSPLSEASELFFALAFAESRVRAAALSSRVSQVCLIDALYLLVARHVKGPSPADAVDEMVERRFRMPPAGKAARTQATREEPA